MKRNFTLDAGVRFYYMTPTQSEGDQVAAFEPGEWNGAQAPRLYQPVVDAAGPPRAQPADRRDSPAGLHRPAGPGLGQLHQRHAGLRRHAAGQLAVPRRAAPRIRVGRDRRRQDRRPRRRRRLLRSLQRRHHPRSDRAAAGAQHLPDQLHDHQRAAGQPVDARRRPRVRRVEPFTPPVVYNWSLGVQRDIGFNLDRRRRLRRQRRPQPAGDGRHQRPAVRLRVSAVEPGSDQRGRADRRSRCRTTSCGPTRASDASSSASSPATRTITRCSCR